MAATRWRSPAALLALSYGALVLYASLYPFAGWRWPPGQDLGALLSLPRAVIHDRFDLQSNLLGYVPLGLLLALTLRGPGFGAWVTFTATVLLCAALSYSTEVLQHFLPRRVPALTDMALNTGGAALGTLLGLSLHGLGLVQRWLLWRDRWFAGSGSVALTLLALWPLGLLFPQPLPLGLGQVADRLQQWGAEVLDGVPWAVGAQTLLAQELPRSAPLPLLPEILIVACGLLGPCLVAYAVMAPGWRRAVMATGAAVLGALAMTASTGLNFGPAHAGAWLTPSALPGMGLGLALALLLVPAPRRLVPGIGLIVLTALVVGVAQAPDDPYFAQSLQAWEQGRFVRFHGLAQWVGWLWPYVAMVWLMSRLGTRA